MEQKVPFLFLAFLKLNFPFISPFSICVPLVYTFYKEALRIGHECLAANSEGLGTIDYINSYGSVSRKD